MAKEVVPAGALDEPGETDVIGRATQPDPEGAPVACWLGVVESLPPGLLCGVMRHEYGHLLGYGHGDPQMQPLLDPRGQPGCPSEPVAAPEEPDWRYWAWDQWRELRAVCREEPRGSRQRRRCFRVSARRARRLRHRYGD